ncbi:MAG: hypothetical protein K2O00_08720 [Muribaculaceae bacterium]|nr:hypothetical protein [Muribaculaceae bacterium]
MKKFVLSLAVIAGLSFVACNNAEQKTEATEETPIEEVAAEVEEATIDGDTIVEGEVAAATDSIPA